MGLGFSEKIRDVSSPDKVSGDEDYIKDGDIDGVETILMTRMLLYNKRAAFQEYRVFLVAAKPTTLVETNSSSKKMPKKLQKSSNL